MVAHTKRKVSRCPWDRNGSGTALSTCMICLGSNSSACASRPSVLQKLPNLRLQREQPGGKSRDSRRVPLEQKKGDPQSSHTAPEELLLQAWKLPQAFLDQEPKWGLNSRNTYGQWELRGFSQPETVCFNIGRSWPCF